MVTVLAQGSEGYYKMGDKNTALYWHDNVNVYALPVLGAACTLSLLGLLDGLLVSSMPPSGTSKVAETRSAAVLAIPYKAYSTIWEGR